MSALLIDPTLVLSEDSSGSEHHDRCDEESSRFDDVFQADTVLQDAAVHVWPFIDDTIVSEADSDSGSWIFDTMAGAWTFVPLTPQAVQVALDAVRYQKNYVWTVTTRLCLHYINTIRMRLSGGVANYLFSVDGCELSQVEPTGRCDVYYCRPYTYELQLTQKSTGSTVFTVQSIYKTIGQKSLTELRGDSNLDISIAPDEDLGTGDTSFIKQAEAPLQSEQPAAWQDDDGGLLSGSNVFDAEEPIAWTNEVNNFLESQPTIAEPVTAQPLSLRAETLSMAASQPKKSPAVGTGSAGASVVAIVGIVAVAVSTVAFVVALAMVRWRARRNTTQCRVNREYSTLRSTLNTTENTISMTSRGSIGDVDPKPDFEKVDFFG